MAGDLFRALHDAFIDPQGVGRFATQHHLLRKAARLFQRIFKDIVDLRPVSTRAGDDASLFQRLHRFTHRNARHTGQLAQIALTRQNITVREHAAAYRVFNS